MSIKVNPFLSIEALNFLPKEINQPQITSESIKTAQAEFSTVANLHSFAENLKKTQLFAKLQTPKEMTNLASAFSSAKIKLGDDEIIKETKRIIYSYNNKIEPKEIKGSRPCEGGKISGHARSQN